MGCLAPIGTSAHNLYTWFKEHLQREEQKTAGVK